MKKWKKAIAYALGCLAISLVTVFAAFYRADIPAQELEQKYLTAESSFLQMQDCRLHYKLRGTGPVVLLIHGNFSSLQTWHDWENILSTSFTTLSVDLPGHGLTGPNHTGNYTPDYYAHLLLALTDSLGIDSLAIAGNSLGGAVAWRMALDAPHKVQRLILVDPAGFKKTTDTDTIPTKTPFLFKLTRWPLVSNALAYSTPKFLFEYNIRQVYADPSKIKNGVVERYYELMLRQGNRKATLQRMQQKALPRFQELSHVSQPTLILWGIQDRWIPVEQAYAFRDKIKHAELILYPEAGHVPMEEIPEKTAQDALDFLLQ